jgi:hypothetical protein
MIFFFLFSVDCEKLRPVYKGNPLINCPYCEGSYSPEYHGKLCLICSFCTVGVSSVGLVSQSNVRGRK